MSFTHLCLFFLKPKTSPLNVTFRGLTKTQPIPWTNQRSSICRAGSLRYHLGRWAGGSRDCLDGLLRMIAASSNELAWQWEKQTCLSAQGNFDLIKSSSLLEKVLFYLSWVGTSWGVSSEEALPKILLRASAYSASRWANVLVCWEGRDEDAVFPAVPLFEGRFKIRIWGGGAAGSESSWITIAVRTGDPPTLDFLDLIRTKMTLNVKLFFSLIEFLKFLRVLTLPPD